MANRPTPGRPAFTTELQAFAGDIPSAYTRRVLEQLRKNGYVVKLQAKLADKGRDNDKGMQQYINNVRKGHTVDWDVLAALKKVTEEVRKSTLQAA